VTVPLHVGERDHHEQAADVEARRGGIEPDVPRQSLAREDVTNPFLGVLYKSAPLKLAIQVHPPLLYNRLCSSAAAPYSKARLPPPSAQ
jgi:hypothetical protein